MFPPSDCSLSQQPVLVSWVRPPHFSLTLSTTGISKPTPLCLLSVYSVASYWFRSLWLVSSGVRGSLNFPRQDVTELFWWEFLKLIGWLEERFNLTSRGTDTYGSWHPERHSVCETFPKFHCPQFRRLPSTLSDLQFRDRLVFPP